jgi:hypothetical protein
MSGPPCTHGAVTTCAVCGTRFDEQRFQVVLLGRVESFDRVECAERRAAGEAERSPVTAWDHQARATA